MKLKRRVLLALFLWLLSPTFVAGQDFKATEAKIAEYKRWLDRVGANGYRLWLRVDNNKRPHRLYVGEGFDRADHAAKERFVEIFSHYLAGHPEKFMLIDIFDGVTGKQIGEFGWAGFKLY